MPEVASPDASPVRRASVARGRLQLGAAGLQAATADVLAAAQAAGLLAAKAAAHRFPTCPDVLLTHAACDLQPDGDAIACTATVQAYARVPLEAYALAACSDALLALWAAVADAERAPDGTFPTARLQTLEVVQDVIL